MISKELLSEVINIKIEDIIDLKMFGKDLKYYEKCLIKSCCDGRLSNHKDSIYKSINIYELENKGKQWANNKGFRIIEIDTDLFWVIPKKYNISYSFSYGMVLSKHNTFFKACQWILDNKKEGN